MAFYGYKCDDDYYRTPYCSFEHDMSPTPIQAASFPYYSLYYFDEPKVSAYDSFITPSFSNYSVYTHSEPYSFITPSFSNYSVYTHSEPDSFITPSYSNYSVYTQTEPDSFITPSYSNYSVYTHTEPESIHFTTAEYHSSYYEYSGNPSHVNYSVFHPTEPKLLQYDPALQDRGYVSSETNFKISYSTQEFNAPEFKEYSPNPYGGGYDPITTYGRPLSPSDEICYPRSTPKVDVVSLDDFSYGSVPSPYGKDDNLSTKPLNDGKETDPKPDQKIPETGDSNVTNLGLEGETGGGKPFPSIPSNDSPSKHDDKDEGDDDGDGFENDRNCRDADVSEIQAHQISYGSGLESMDLCESIFGYWPCLEKIEQQQQQREKCRAACDQESKNDPWKIAADYLFGNPMVYNFENYHYQQHNQSQYQSYGNSWLH